MEEENKPKKKKKLIPWKEVKDLKTARAIIDNRSGAKAYEALHPNAKKNTAHSHGYELLTPEVFDKVKQLLAMDKPAEVNKDTLEKLYMLIITRYMSGKESGSNYIQALNGLSKLTNTKEFDDYSKKSPEELDKEIEKLLRGNKAEDVTSLE